MREATVSPGTSGQGRRTREEDFAVADRGQEVLYQAEHGFAWFAAAGAIALGVVAALVGFGVIESQSTVAAIGQPETPGTLSNELANGLLWALPGLSAAILSYSMHRAEHHRRRAPLNKPESEQAYFAFEHFMAMIAGTVAIALGVVALLVGFDVFDRGNVQGDGYLWGLLSVGASTLSLTFHTVVHHQMAREDAYDEHRVTSIVDERLRGSTITPGTERRRAGTR